MACNCNEQGRIINIGMGCCVPVVANADNYYTKSEVDQKLDDIVISGGGVTSGVVESMIDDAMEYKQDVLTAGDGIEIDEDNIISVTGGIITIDEQLNSGSTNAVANSAITKAINDVTESIPTVPTDVSAFRNDVGYLTEHQPIKTINNISLIGEGNIEISTGGTISIDNQLDSGSTNAVANSAITLAINSKLDTSAYTPTDLSEYWTSAQTQSAITQAVSGKADTTYVTNNFMSKNSIWCGTEQQWAQISGNPQSDVIYMVY